MIPLPPSVLGRYILSTSELGWCILYIVFVFSLVSYCDVESISYHWYCQGVDGFRFVCGIQLRLECHQDPAVLFFPDLLFHLRVLDSVSLVDSEVPTGIFLFWVLDDRVDVELNVTGVG